MRMARWIPSSIPQATTLPRTAAAGTTAGLTQPDGPFDPGVYLPDLQTLHDMGIFISTPVGNGEVQYGPNGPQWCSDALLEAIAEASARNGRRIHMHLLETRYQRAWADAAHPEGVVRHRRGLGSNPLQME